MKSEVAKDVRKERSDDMERLVEHLVEKFGGPHAVLEELTASLEASGERGDVTEDTSGYCYLRLFDRVEHRDAKELGPCPTVAELRRFSNGRSDPFGVRTVIVKVHAHDNRRVGHVTYDSGLSGLRPLAALSALAKDLHLGLPDGVSDNWPEDWIPAYRYITQSWVFTEKHNPRNLDALAYVGNQPSCVPKGYEDNSHPTSRVKWVLRANPLGPVTDIIDVIDPLGKVRTCREWTSYVAHASYHQGWRVRGVKVFAEAYVWVAARILTDPHAPSPEPTPVGGHDELFQSTDAGILVDASKPELFPGILAHRVKGTTDEDGYCYEVAFRDKRGARKALGKFPTVEKILNFSRVSGAAVVSARLHVRSSNGDEPPVHHATTLEDNQGVDFWETLSSLPRGDLVGSTQEVVRDGKFENVAAPATLTIRPRAQGMLVNVPFVAILKAGDDCLLWDISSGKKFSNWSSYFESVELVSMSIRVTVHKGDNDTLVSLVADTIEGKITQDSEWIGAPHTLHVSGNISGATSGEMKIEGNHGFGTQLRGASVGNPTPIIQAKLVTTVAAVAYIKIMAAVRVSGTGLPRAMVLPTYTFKGGMNGSAGAGMDDNDSD